MKSKLKDPLIIPMLLAGFFSAYSLEREYQSFVLYFIKLANPDRIQFIGKISQYLFHHNLTFNAVNAIFIMLAYLLLRKVSKKQFRIRSFISISLFFIITIGTSIFDSFRHVVECSACGDDGPVRIWIEEKTYHKHLIFSSVIILAYLFICYVIDRKRNEKMSNKKDSAPFYHGT